MAFYFVISRNNIIFENIKKLIQKFYHIILYIYYKS